MTDNIEKLTNQELLDIYAMLKEYLEYLAIEELKLQEEGKK